MKTADLLEIPEVRAQVSPVSVDQYHTFPERNENGRPTELVRGVVIEKMAKSPLHASITSLLLKFIFPQLPAAFSLRVDQPLTLRDSEPEPDITIVRGSLEDFWDAHPSTAALAIEIAVTSFSLDREKASLYAEAFVEEYWIVLPKLKRVDVYRGPVDGGYCEKHSLEGDTTIECRSVPGIRVPLAELFR